MPNMGERAGGSEMARSPLLDLFISLKPRGPNQVLDSEAITPKDFKNCYRFIEESVTKRRKIEEESQ
jgi:hypothetical protein